MYIPRRKVDTAMCSSTLAKERVHTPTRINISLDIYVDVQRRYTHIYAVVCIIKCIHTQACGEHDSGCDAFHICVSQSPTTKFACRAHRWTMCGQSAGNPPYSLHPQAPISIMKLHRIKQTSGRHDELFRSVESPSCFSRARIGDTVVDRLSFRGPSSLDMHARRDIHPARHFTPPPYRTTVITRRVCRVRCASLLSLYGGEGLSILSSCSLYRRELYSKLRIVFSLMYCGYAAL